MSGFAIDALERCFMLRRLAPAVLTATVFAAALTGCSSVSADGVDRGDCKPALGPGALSNSVVVLGGFGVEPEVKIPTDTEISVAQRTFVDTPSEGGTVAKSDTLLSWNYAFYDQHSGAQLAASPGFGTNDSSVFMIMPESEAMDPISAALSCSVPGERVVSAFSPADSQGLAQALGVSASPNSSIIGVLDVVAVAPNHAEGTARALPSGFPAVVTNESGTPGVVLPPRSAPDGLTKAVRIEGNGSSVEAENRLVLQVLTVGWDGTLQKSTWDTDSVQPAGSEDEAESQGDTLRAQLTGVKVGSQVVITEGGDNARVHVVDVLAAG